jgi:hypothetical protein
MRVIAGRIHFGQASEPNRMLASHCGISVATGRLNDSDLCSFPAMGALSADIGVLYG